MTDRNWRPSWGEVVGHGSSQAKAESGQETGQSLGGREASGVGGGPGCARSKCQAQACILRLEASGSGLRWCQWSVPSAKVTLFVQRGCPSICDILRRLRSLTNIPRLQAKWPCLGHDSSPVFARSEPSPWEQWDDALPLVPGRGWEFVPACRQILDGLSCCCPQGTSGAWCGAWCRERDAEP